MDNKSCLYVAIDNITGPDKVRIVNLLLANGAKANLGLPCIVLAEKLKLVAIIPLLQIEEAKIDSEKITKVGSTENVKTGISDMFSDNKLPISNNNSHITDMFSDKK